MHRAVLFYTATRNVQEIYKSSSSAQHFISTSEILAILVHVVIFMLNVPISVLIK